MDWIGYLHVFTASGPYILAFLADGAHKRFKKFFPDYPHIVCGKERDVANPLRRIVTVRDGDAMDRHCVMVANP